MIDLVISANDIYNLTEKCIFFEKIVYLDFWNILTSIRGLKSHNSSRFKVGEQCFIGVEIFGKLRLYLKMSNKSQIFFIHQFIYEKSKVANFTTNDNLETFGSTLNDTKKTIVNLFALFDKDRAS